MLWNVSKQLNVLKRFIFMGRRDDIIKQIIELREKGYSFSEIAKKLGLSKTTVWRYYKEWEEKNRKTTTTTAISTAVLKTGIAITSLELVQNILENVKALERSLDDINRRLKIVENKVSTIYDVSRLRVEGKLKCKYVDEYGYCTKIFLDKCPESLECTEIILEGGVKAYRIRVTVNSVVCLVCPYYTPKKKI